MERVLKGFLPAYTLSKLTHSQSFSHTGFLTVAHTHKQTLHTHNFQTPPPPSSPPHSGTRGMCKYWSLDIRLENYPHTQISKLNRDGDS